MLTEVVDAADAKALLDLADRVKGKLGDSAAIVLGTAVDGRVHLVAAVAPALVQRGVKAGEVVKAAAQVAGGGGGGRDTMAQAGGRDPDKLPEAIAAARAAIEAALACIVTGLVRVLALDYGSARCGCALSDPTGTLATPIDPIERPDHPARLRAGDGARPRAGRRAGRRRAFRSASAAPTPTRRARRARSPTACAGAVAVPVEMYDERFTTAIAARATGARTSEDSRAAAVLLDDWLVRHAAEAAR